jgi:lipopolysaccharide transport system ATP-binding protein
MNDVSQMGRTVLFVSHNLATIQSLCSRAILLDSGRTVLDDKPRLVIETYVTRLDENNELTGYRDLRHETKRQGNGEIRFVSARILNMHGQTTSTLQHRESFNLQLEVESTTEIQIPDLGFGVVARDGTQVLGTDANIAIPDARLKKGTNLLECHVSPDVLIPGKYSLRAGIFRTGILTYDYIENILTFEILGLEPHGDDGVCRVYLPYQWTIRT